MAQKHTNRRRKRRNKNAEKEAAEKKRRRKFVSRLRSFEHHAPAYSLKISNVVSTAWVGQPVNVRLVQLATQGRFDVAVFPSSVSRARYPRTTNSLFDTGRVLITGAPSIEEAVLSCTSFVYKINEVLDMDLQVLLFKVQNIVSSFSLGYAFNVDMFYHDQKATKKGSAHYDPALFRGCSWRRDDGIALVLFLSGRVVLTGARSWEEAWDVYNNVLPLLERYKLGHEYTKWDSRYKRTRKVDVGL